MVELGKFQEYLGKEDKIIFHELLDHCKIYSSFASGMTYSIKEVPLLVSILFGQQKRIIGLEKKLEKLENAAKTNSVSNTVGNNLDHFAENQKLA